MKYFTLVLLLAVVVFASAFPYESFGKRRRDGGKGRAGGGSGSGGKTGGQGTGGKGPGGRGPESSGSEAEGAGDQQQKQGPGEQDAGAEVEQVERHEIGSKVTDECRAFLEDWYEYMGAVKEAKEEDEAGEVEEARALKLLKQLERELFKRQEKPDDTACADSFNTKAEAESKRCPKDTEDEGCEEFRKLDAAYTEFKTRISELSGGTEEAPPLGAVCFDIVSYPFGEAEKELAEPERRKREAGFIYGYFWQIVEDAHILAGACVDNFWGRPEGKGEGEGEGQRPDGDQGQGGPQGGEKGQGGPQGGDQGLNGGEPTRRELIDFLLRKMNGN